MVIVSLTFSVALQVASAPSERSIPRAGQNESRTLLSDALRTWSIQLWRPRRVWRGTPGSSRINPSLAFLMEWQELPGHSLKPVSSAAMPDTAGRRVKLSSTNAHVSPQRSRIGRIFDRPLYAQMGRHRMGTRPTVHFGAMALAVLD